MIWMALAQLLRFLLVVLTEEEAFAVMNFILIRTPQMATLLAALTDPAALAPSRNLAAGELRMLVLEGVERGEVVLSAEAQQYLRSMSVNEWTELGRSLAQSRPADVTRAMNTAREQAAAAAQRAAGAAEREAAATEALNQYARQQVHMGGSAHFAPLSLGPWSSTALGSSGATIVRSGSQYMLMRRDQTVAAIIPRNVAEGGDAALATYLNQIRSTVRFTSGL